MWHVACGMWHERKQENCGMRHERKQRKLRGVEWGEGKNENFGFGAISAHGART